MFNFTNGFVAAMRTCIHSSLSLCLVNNTQLHIKTHRKAFKGWKPVHKPGSGENRRGEKERPRVGHIMDR